MKKIEWSDEMSVGHTALDQQHQALFSLYNDLAGLLAGHEGDGSHPSGSILFQMLLDYINVHFDCEEALLGQAGYPDLVRHQAQHEMFVKTVMTAQEGFGPAGDIDGQKQLCLFLGDWLVGHVMKMDRLYAPYILDVADGSP